MKCFTLFRWMGSFQISFEIQEGPTSTARDHIGSPLPSSRDGDGSLNINHNNPPLVDHEVESPAHYAVLHNCRKVAISFGSFRISFRLDSYDKIILSAFLSITPPQCQFEIPSGVLMWPCLRHTKKVFGLCHKMLRIPPLRGSIQRGRRPLLL